MIKRVSLQPSPYENYYFMKIYKEDLPLIDKNIEDSVLLARIFNLDYNSFCRMCRDICGAQLKRGVGYPIIYFIRNQQTLTILEIANKRLNYAVDAQRQA